jgi:hypothetical protein
VDPFKYIYAPCSDPEKHMFVEWFKNLEIDPTSLWLFLGDFNLMRSSENRNIPGGNHNEMMIFNEMISQQALMKIPLKGCQYTWSNMQEETLLEQLDCPQKTQP